MVGQTVCDVKQRSGGCQNAPPSCISSEGGCDGSMSRVVMAKNDPPSRVLSEGGGGGPWWVRKSSPSLTPQVGEQATCVVSKLLKIRNNGRTLYACPVVLVLSHAMKGWSGGGC